MSDRIETVDTLSPWWRNAVVLVMVFGFTILIWRSVATYSDAPPIPAKAVDSAGETIFASSDILGGQQVFLKYGLIYLGSGIVGTGHHWYWTGQSEITMALAALFSAMEVVPLTLLTLDAWDFVKLSSGHCDICNQPVSVPHRWTFYFLMAVGFWNFLGAGVFGFLINLPVVSYFEVGTILTPNHGHASMMGVFGMLGVALVVFALRQLSSDSVWASIEKYVRISFWGLNVGLFLMVTLNLFPGGVLQLLDVLQNGYWHARGPLFLQDPTVRLVEWLRMPADIVFIGLGVVPLALASLIAYKATWRPIRAAQQ